MINVIVLGGIIRSKKFVVTPNGNSYCRLSLEVQRPYRAREGRIVTDLFTIMTWNSFAKATDKRARIGDIIMVSGMMQLAVYQNEDGEHKYFNSVQAKQIKFLSNVWVPPDIQHEDRIKPPPANTQNSISADDDDGEDLPY